MQTLGSAKSGGAYTPNDALAIYISGELVKNNPEALQETYWHEYTHLHIFTSTAFGHVQQAFATLLTSIAASNDDGMPGYLLSPINKYLSVLYETAWDVHEGVATITPHLMGNAFSLSLIHQGTYSNLPIRYINAATNFATAVGAITPTQLSRYGYIFANAVAQFCLNSDILLYSAEYWKGAANASQAGTMDIYNYISVDVHNPQARLFRLISELYKDENNKIPEQIRNIFFEKIREFDFVQKQSDGRTYVDTSDAANLLRLQDALNKIILDELDKLLPGWLAYKSVADFQSDMHCLLDAISQSGLNVVTVHNSMASDINARATFSPRVNII